MQWNPWAVDLTANTAQWQSALSDQDKGLVYWALSSLMVAEERITTKFAGPVMAAETEEEASYAADKIAPLPEWRLRYISACRVLCPAN